MKPCLLEVLPRAHWTSCILFASVRPVKIEETIKNARQVVLTAGEIALGYFNQLQELKTEYKGTQDVVSAADRHVERYIKTSVSKFDPEGSFKGEETGGSFSGTGWVVDPIDGTHNFLKGLKAWCVCLAYLENYQVVFSLVYAPATDELFFARKNAGAFVNGQKITVSEEHLLERSFFCLGHSYRASNDDWIRVNSRLTEKKVALRLLGSAALAMCYVGDGRFDGFYESHLNPWDVFAASLIITEAGGVFHKLDYESFCRAGGEVLASTPALIGPFTEALMT